MTKYLLTLFSFFSIHAFSQLWQNDFSNAAEWISTDLNAGIDSWVISSAAIGGDVDSINSPSAGNGFAQFNSEGQCNAAHQDVVLMYYQTIDISGNELSYLEFVQHYKRKSDSVYVEFSNDGLTWESFRINNEYWYYQQTADPDTVQVSIPTSVQAAPFWMRFRYSGECGFGWLMDDLKIFEKDEYAIQVNGQIHSKGLGHVQIASCYTNSLDGSFQLTNFGYDTLFNITIKSSVYQDGVFVNTENDVLPQINPLETIVYTQMEIIQGPLIIAAEYILDAKVYSNDLDTTMVSDSVSITFNDTDRYDGSVEGHFPLNSADITAIGNIFIPTEDMCVMRPYLYIPDIPSFAGTPVFAAVYRKNGTSWNYVSSTPDVDVDISDLDTWKQLSFGFPGSDLLFSAGDTGVVFYGTYGGSQPIPYGAPDPLGSYYMDDAGNVLFDPEGHAAFIRLHPYANYTCDVCWESIKENESVSLDIFPNPAITEIQIQNLTESLQSVKIFSLDGREVYSNFEAFSEIIPVSFLETGTYFILVETTNGNFYSDRFIKF